MTKTTLSGEDVKKVASLIKIKISEESIENYQSQLNKVLDNLEVFEELDTKDVPITSQVTGLVNVLREDVVEKSLSQEEALKNAHKSENGFFVVKRVVNK